MARARRSLRSSPQTCSARRAKMRRTILVSCCHCLSACLFHSQTWRCPIADPKPRRLGASWQALNNWASKQALLAVPSSLLAGLPESNLLIVEHIELQAYSKESCGCRPPALAFTHEAAVQEGRPRVVPPAGRLLHRRQGEYLLPDLSATLQAVCNVEPNTSPVLLGNCWGQARSKLFTLQGNYLHL